MKSDFKEYVIAKIGEIFDTENGQERKMCLHIQQTKAL